LPLAPDRPSAHRAPAERGSERVAANRVLVCVIDEAAPEQALRFACGVLERARAHGRATAALLGDDVAHAGAGQRLRALGASVSVLMTRELPNAALDALSELPHDAVAVALGASLAACMRGALTVRAGASRASALAGVECDLEFAHDDGVLATLIGDWIALHLERVSAEDPGSTAKTSRA
jgi:hypothetical protein